MNQLNERLRVVKNQIAYLKKEMKQETDRNKLMNMALDIQELKLEEEDLLRKLGL